MRGLSLLTPCGSEVETGNMRRMFRWGRLRDASNDDRRGLYPGVSL